MSESPSSQSHGLPGLKVARERAGWSKTELARRLGVTFQSVYRWERGHMGCSDAMLRQIVKILADANVVITADELMGIERGVA